MRPFRLFLKASGYVINYIWHCFLCIYVHGSTICPRRLKQGKWGSKTPCQNDKSILIHAHTHARLHTNTHFQQRDVSTVVRGHFHCLCGALFPPHHPLSSSSTAARLAFSPAILLSVGADRAEPHSTFSSKLSQTLALTLCWWCSSSLPNVGFSTA